MLEKSTIMSKNDSEPCRDHWGVVYNSKAEMCEAYGVSKELYDARISRGLSMKEALVPVLKVK